PPKRKRRRRAAVAAGELRLVGDSAMVDAIRKAGVRLLTAEMEIGLARVTDRPFANAVVEVEQPGLVGDFGTRLGGDEAARRRRRDRRLLLARPLADEAAGTDRAILHFGRGPVRRALWCCRSGRLGRNRRRGQLRRGVRPGSRG